MRDEGSIKISYRNHQNHRLKLQLYKTNWIQTVSPIVWLAEKFSKEQESLPGNYCNCLKLWLWTMKQWLWSRTVTWSAMKIDGFSGSCLSMKWWRNPPVVLYSFGHSGHLIFSVFVSATYQEKFLITNQNVWRRQTRKKGPLKPSPVAFKPPRIYSPQSTLVEKFITLMRNLSNLIRLPFQMPPGTYNEKT